MADHDERDRQTHENLQRLGQHLDFPEQPSDQKRDQWQALLSDRQPAPRIIARGAVLMKRHRTLTLIGSGALAASVLLAILLVSAGTPSVSAAVIMTDLRLALGESILIQFRNIELDYADLASRLASSQLKRGTVSCSGRVFVPNRPTQEAFWIMEEVHLRGLSASEVDAGGFSADAELIACLRDESPWFFLQMNDAPVADPAEFGAQAAFLLALRSGVYVTLPSLAFETWDGKDDRQVRIISPEFANLRDLQSVLGRLEEMATNITVEETEEGLFVLTASGFQQGLSLPVADGSRISPGARQGLEAWLRDRMKDQVVEVGYRMDEGVRWIKVRHFGTPEGCIDIQVGDVEFDGRLFDLDYHLERRPAPVVDASAMLALVDMFDRRAAGKPQ